MVLAGENEALGRRLAVPAGRDLEGNLLPFVQRSKASPLDGADMDEYVSGAILRLDEPVTLGRVEPLDSTCSHYRSLSRQSGEAPPHAAPLEKRSQCRGRNLTARSRGQSVQQQRLGNAGRSIHAKSKRASATLRSPRDSPRSRTRSFFLWPLGGRKGRDRTEVAPERLRACSPSSGICSSSGLFAIDPRFCAAVNRRDREGDDVDIFEQQLSRHCWQRGKCASHVLSDYAAPIRPAIRPT